MAHILNVIKAKDKEFQITSINQDASDRAKQRPGSCNNPSAYEY